MSRRLTSREYQHLLLYLLTNCEDVLPYERLFTDSVRLHYPDKPESELEDIKQNEFAAWLHYYVHRGSSNESFPTWLVELVSGPNYEARSFPRYATRGYAFRVNQSASSRLTYDSGVCTRGGDTVYYGVIKEILEIRIAGLLGMRCVVLQCDWYDPTPGRGFRIDEFGVTSIHSRRRLQKYDPFILASQGDQVCYIPYPRLTNRNDPWITVTLVSPRGKIYGSEELNPLQTESPNQPQTVSIRDREELVVDLTVAGDDILPSGSEEEIGEFDEDSDSLSSANSSDSD